MSGGCLEGAGHTRYKECNTILQHYKQVAAVTVNQYGLAQMVVSRYPTPSMVIASHGCFIGFAANVHRLQTQTVRHHPEALGLP